MAQVPILLYIAFGLTTVLAVWLFCRAVPRRALVVAAGLALWLLGQGVLALTGFYTNTHALPPRLLLAVGPPLLVALLLVITPRGRHLLAQLWPDALTLFHVVRVPVEVVLFGLAQYRAVPTLMTFEGRNWDILTGLTAPLLYYLVFRRRQLGRRALLVWNLVGLGLLVNIVAHAVLAVPSPLQQLAFEQPNVAVLYFPFGWLPAGVVPLVLVAHLAALWQLRQPAWEPAGVA
ncbi:hypothetical protein [Hymenobacter swuensis]|uniref:Uncharacterized protein n=1 Tax=Hymenobacter swuensis DY53 TaxID=1227739 RepID=W8F1Y0_9BACT|nr:hypothetical protein [Hymenobacter swuensis]AHJ98012.1 hypothetical protein Hsw_2417 [Hymenobacter swuensis DY53]